MAVASCAVSAGWGEVEEAGKAYLFKLTGFVSFYAPVLDPFTHPIDNMPRVQRNNPTPVHLKNDAKGMDAINIPFDSVWVI